MPGKRGGEIPIKEQKGDRSWREKGKCKGVDPALLFPLSESQVEKGKSVCIGCPVRENCLQFALENGEKYGIWGGYSEKELNRIRRQRRLAG